ncbi:MAG: hypothetical protein KAJ48_07885, partial [Elusimicrobiales bacterium]|nr:hypothetical protein [Elusimicrobiales bacterium]
IIKEVVIKKTGISEETWEKGEEFNGSIPLRPPYEAWAQKKEGCRMYIAGPEAERDFNEKNVITIK